MNSNKYEILIGLSGALIFVGFILFFVKLLIGFFVFAAGIVSFSFVSKKHPNLHQEWLDKYSKENIKAAPLKESRTKEFKITHIEGISFVNPNQELFCKIYPDVIDFVDDSQTILGNANYNDITNVTILEEIEQTRKNKSVIGRAIVGGILLGPAAAIIGGISGAVPTMQNNKKYYLKIELNNETREIIITGQNKVLKELKECIIQKVN